MTDLERTAEAVKATIDAIVNATQGGDIDAAKFAATSQLRRDTSAFTHELMILIRAAA